MHYHNNTDDRVIILKCRVYVRCRGAEDGDLLVETSFVERILCVSLTTNDWNKGFEQCYLNCILQIGHVFFICSKTQNYSVFSRKIKTQNFSCSWTILIIICSNLASKHSKKVVFFLNF